ncbi:hypothetical protein MHK_005768 [Candidatus Magnetomorum sp. HK-1]|nr:hypothetical protein MHK_005768 [Candidatus Magnetomorum sp. HK-1]
MFDRKTYSQMRRAGFGVGVSKEKVKQAMVEILLQLPKGTTNLKETVIYNLGQYGQMTPVRDLNTIWNQAKKKVAKSNPEKFILDGRNALHWNDGSVNVLDKKISSANFKKLNELAESEGCSVNAVVSKLIKTYKK